MSAFARVILLVCLASSSAAQATVIDFESVPATTKLTDEFESLGVSFAGAGNSSGLVLTEGDFGTANYGNSPDKFVHAGEWNQPTTITFVDPASPSTVVGATSVSLLLGDGNVDTETFNVTYREIDGTILQGPTAFTTNAEGLFLFETQASLGALIGSLEISLENTTGVTFDDLSFSLAGGPPPPQCPNRLVDFESIAASTLVRNQFNHIGLDVDGTGAFSGLVITEGFDGTANYSNSPTQILHVGLRDEPTTISFIQPGNPSTIVGASSVSFLFGDGHPDLETFDVVVRDPTGAIILGPLWFTTASGSGLFSLDSASLGALIGSIELTLVSESESGVTIDDLCFDLSGTQVPALGPVGVLVAVALLMMFTFLVRFRRQGSVHG